jgi:hypothetical protein
MTFYKTEVSGGFSTELFAGSIGLKPASLRVHLCRHGSYYGLVPERLPNGRLLWPINSIEKLKELGRAK